MNYNPDVRRAAEIRALTATLAIAGQARWSIGRVGPVLDLPVANYLYVDRAQLLLIPTSSALPRAMAVADRAMRQARSDALIIRAVNGHPDKIELALGQWKLTENQWYMPMTLWHRSRRPLWLVPDPYHVAVRHECFELHDATMRSAAAPWAGLHEYREGLDQGAAWMSRVLAPR
ncbi:hypothetical protein ACFOKI_01350 [Sphingomonas qilianensis]|uniref:Uncharacterized protein n=1 Tax=Sphingomonas qilianensis TaxID=1736690 RepID=A0ABU9XSE9_9SPHN